MASGTGDDDLQRGFYSWPLAKAWGGTTATSAPALPPPGHLARTRSRVRMRAQERGEWVVERLNLNGVLTRRLEAFAGRAYGLFRWRSAVRKTAHS